MAALAKKSHSSNGRQLLHDKPSDSLYRPEAHRPDHVVVVAGDATDAGPARACLAVRARLPRPSADQPAMTTLTSTRQQLDTLLADLEAREQSVAQAAEQLTESAAVQAAWQQGGTAERDRITALIDHQLEQLHRGGTNALVLTTLRRMVVEVVA